MLNNVKTCPKALEAKVNASEAAAKTSLNLTVFDVMLRAKLAERLKRWVAASYMALAMFVRLRVCETDLRASSSLPVSKVAVIA